MSCRRQLSSRRTQSGSSMSWVLARPCQEGPGDIIWGMWGYLDLRRQGQTPLPTWN